MQNKTLRISVALVALIAGAYLPQAAAELSTLFTTPEERHIINSNRYKTDDAQPVEMAVDEPEIEVAAVQQLVQEEITQQYTISGISISREGPSTVWINSLSYEDGEQLEDSSKIKVITGDEVRVRITAPDGKNYYATSGETLDVTYLAPIEN